MKTREKITISFDADLLERVRREVLRAKLRGEKITLREFISRALSAILLGCKDG